MFHIDSTFLFSFSLTCCCSLFLNYFAWTHDGWIICKNNFYELGMNNLYDSVNAIKIEKQLWVIQVVSYKSFNIRPDQCELNYLASSEISSMILLSISIDIILIWMKPFDKRNTSLPALQNFLLPIIPFSVAFSK